MSVYKTKKMSVYKTKKIMIKIPNKIKSQKNEMYNILMIKET